MNSRNKSQRHDCTLELDKRVADHMRQSGRWVLHEAREHVLRLDPNLAARIDALTNKGRTPR